MVMSSTPYIDGVGSLLLHSDTPLTRSVLVSRLERKSSLLKQQGKDSKELGLYLDWSIVQKMRHFLIWEAGDSMTGCRKSKLMC